MKKSMVFGIVIISVLLLLSGCSKKPAAEDNTTAEQPGAEVPEDSGDDIVVVGDGTDTQVETPEDSGTDDGTEVPEGGDDTNSDVEPPVNDTAPVPVNTTNTTKPLPNIPTNIQPSDASDAIVVMIKDFKFLPKEVTIRKGMTVTWKNEDYYKDSIRIHKIMPRRKYEETPGWQSEQIPQGGSYSYIFNQTGEFEYVDAVFLKTKGTEGKIIVK